MLDDARRLGLLAAIGIDVYRLREPAAAAAADPPGFAAQAPAHGAARLVVAARGAAAAQRGANGALARVVRALGVDAAQVAWLEVDASVEPVGAAPAYLLVGAEAARSVCAQLPIEQQQAATIAVIDEPDAIRGGAARAALWQALKPLARRLRGG